MLITRHGFKMFVDYDLDGNLRNFLNNIQREIEADRQVLEIEEGEYLKNRVAKHSLQPLVIYPDKITVSQKEYPIPSNYFPRSFDVDRGQSFPKQVFTFHLPFGGDPQWLKCRPSSFMHWTEEVDVQNNEIIFEVINFRNNPEEIKKERDEFVSKFQSQIGNLNKDIEGYNSQLGKVIGDSISKAKSKFKNQDDILSSLGNPLK
jgi:hypothetical protein